MLVSIILGASREVLEAEQRLLLEVRAPTAIEDVDFVFLVELIGDVDYSVSDVLVESQLGLAVVLGEHSADLGQHLRYQGGEQLAI